MNEIIFYILVAYGALASFAFVMYLPKIFGMRYGFRKPPYKRAAEKRNIAVIIPARRRAPSSGICLPRSSGRPMTGRIFRSM